MPDDFAASAFPLPPDRYIPQPQELVLAILAVAGATAACAEHGYADAVRALLKYYALSGFAVGGLDGRIVKAMGDGILAVFSVTRVKDIDRELRELQRSGTILWRTYDPRCKLQIKVGAGTLMAGEFGPPGQEAFDVYGDALNQLFKAPLADYFVTEAVAALLRAPGSKPSN
jgi:class 3 adenylate cyclase